MLLWMWKVHWLTMHTTHTHPVGAHGASSAAKGFWTCGDKLDMPAKTKTHKVNRHTDQRSKQALHDGQLEEM
jgi:hypothetical protein